MRKYNLDFETIAYIGGVRIAQSKKGDLLVKWNFCDGHKSDTTARTVPIGKDLQKAKAFARQINNALGISQLLYMDAILHNLLPINETIDSKERALKSLCLWAKSSDPKSSQLQVILAELIYLMESDNENSSNIV